MTDEPPRVRRAVPADLDALAEMGAELARLHHAMDPRRFMYGDDFVAGGARRRARSPPRRAERDGRGEREEHGDPHPASVSEAPASDAAPLTSSR